MTKIKLCGLFRAEDIEFANEARPDYIGFVINYPRSHRSISPEKAAVLRSLLQPGITPVGVFVDQPPELVAQLCEEGTIEMIQLHGNEDEEYVSRLRTLTKCPIIRAFRVAGKGDVTKAALSRADYILLDGGAGSGAAFDWALLDGIERMYFLAGGLTPERIRTAAATARPYGFDLSSGVETGKRKDKEKMIAAVKAAHGEEEMI